MTHLSKKSKQPIRVDQVVTLLLMKSLPNIIKTLPEMQPAGFSVYCLFSCRGLSVKPAL
jgi:hypothetical protein